MVIKDESAKELLAQANSYDLYEALHEYPKDEVDGRSDIQMVADECSYLLSCYEEEGHMLHDSLAWVKRIMKDTKNGTKMPFLVNKDGKILRPKYRKSDVKMAKDNVAEVDRLKTLIKTLNKKGVHGKWQ